MEIEQLLEEGNVIRIKIRGYSMYPLLVPGRDEVLVHQENPTTLKRGDVVLYRRDEGILVLHRIWKCDGENFYMVGDNQSAVEGPLRAEQMKGRMIAFVRKEKKVSTKQPVYRIYSRLWLFLRPVRPVISKVIHWLKKLWK